MATDLEIARAAVLRPIAEIAARAGVPEWALEPYGAHKAKISLDFVAEQRAKPQGKLVLVTGITPTAAGEGKTTTTIGLGDALNARGTRTMICLREPSLGPCFGVKGGATGGGRAQVAPMESINLHFTGDLHAVTSAHNLLSAMLDNHLHWGNALGLDPRRVAWRRAVDMNDRALRHLVLGLGGPGQGVPREDGFDITVASEVMAILCLASDLADLQARLGRIIVGQAREGGRMVTARDLQADGAMAALLRDALAPNLVQTLEGSPALVHGGPFANIAHGCNSAVATRLGLSLADVVVTEAGFGADLGAEKFCDIKCRFRRPLARRPAWSSPPCARSRCMAACAKAELAREDLAALRAGLPNLLRHVENMRKFGLPVVVALNRFTGDTEAETALVRRCARGARHRGGSLHALGRRRGRRRGARRRGRAHARRRRGALPAALSAGDAARRQAPHDRARDLPRRRRRPAGAGRRAAQSASRRRASDGSAFAWPRRSTASAPTRPGAARPDGHVLPVRDVRLSAGAGFVVAICGDVMTMPGLPRRPAAESIRLDAEGRIEGLF